MLDVEGNVIHGSLGKVEQDARFGRLTLLRVLPVEKNTCRRPCICRCDCGNEIETNWTSLKRGSSESCGCLQRELQGKRVRTHGMTNTPEFEAWHSMLGRCNNQSHGNYPRYGAKGISVCARWQESFENFYADVGQRPSSKHSLDRYPNNDGNYEPGNVRWATDQQQSENRSTSVMVTIGDESHCLRHWCRIKGLVYKRVWRKVRRGIDPVLALS